MSLFERARFEAFVLGLPHVTLVRKEGDGAVIEVDGPNPHLVPVSRTRVAEVKARLGLARRHPQRG